MPLPIVKGPKNGTCNICGETKDLTADHVPPKGVIKFPRVALHRLVESLGSRPGEKKKGRHFQQGVKFRSICKECNRDFLGSLYDPALIYFSNKVSEYLFSQIYRPRNTTFNIQSDLVCKAVCGHILAIGPNHFPRGEMGDAMAEFVLDPSSKCPNTLGIYYWVYPYWDQVSIKGMSMLIRFGTPPISFSLLKFTPLAFMVTWNLDSGIDVPYPDLTNYLPSKSNDYKDIPLDFSILPPQRYPEMPGKEGVTMHGEFSYLAKRIKKTNKKATRNHEQWR